MEAGAGDHIPARRHADQPVHRSAGQPLWETLKQDWRYVRDDVRPGWRAMLRTTLAELEEFYLTPEHRQRLAGMGALRRWLWLGWLAAEEPVPQAHARSGGSCFLVALVLLASVAAGRRPATVRA